MTASTPKGRRTVPSPPLDEKINTLLDAFLPRVDHGLPHETEQDIWTAKRSDALVYLVHSLRAAVALDAPVPTKNRLVDLVEKAFAYAVNEERAAAQRVRARLGGGAVEQPTAHPSSGDSLEVEA